MLEFPLHRPARRLRAAPAAAPRRPVPHRRLLRRRPPHLGRDGAHRRGPARAGPRRPADVTGGVSSARRPSRRTSRRRRSARRVSLPLNAGIGPPPLFDLADDRRLRRLEVVEVRPDGAGRARVLQRVAALAVLGEDLLALGRGVLGPACSPSRGRGCVSARRGRDCCCCRCRRRRRRVRRARPRSAAPNLNMARTVPGNPAAESQQDSAAAPMAARWRDRGRDRRRAAAGPPFGSCVRREAAPTRRPSRSGR